MAMFLLSRVDVATKRVFPGRPHQNALLGERGFELRDVVKSLDLFCRYLALLALSHLFSRQATRKSDILYTYSVTVVAFGLAVPL